MLTTMPPHGSALFAPVSAQTYVQSLVFDVAVQQFLQKLWPQPVASSLQIQRHIPLLPADREQLQHVGGRCTYCIAVTGYGFVGQALFANRLTVGLMRKSFQSSTSLSWVPLYAGSLHFRLNVASATFSGPMHHCM